MNFRGFSKACAFPRKNMVNGLLTIFIKVNVLFGCRITHREGAGNMKKQTRGFWGWLLGEGWTNTGGNA